MSRIARRNIVPVNQITPLTYRDGVTYIQMLNELSEYVKSILHPSLQHTVDQLVADVEAQMDKHHDQYVEGIQEFQRIHDQFMSDVNANLMALNDTAVSDLVDDASSLLGGILRRLFVDVDDYPVFYRMPDGGVQTLQDTLSRTGSLTLRGDYVFDRPLVVPSGVNVDATAARITLDPDVDWTREYGNRGVIEFVSTEDATWSGGVFDAQGQHARAILMLDTTGTTVEHVTLKNFAVDRSVSSSGFLTLIARDDYSDVRSDIPEVYENVFGPVEYNTFRDVHIVLEPQHQAAFGTRFLTDWVNNRAHGDYTNRVAYNTFENLSVHGEFHWNHIELAGGGTQHNSFHGVHTVGKSLNAFDIDKAASWNTATNLRLEQSGLPTQHVGTSSAILGVLAIHGSETTQPCIGNTVDTVFIGAADNPLAHNRNNNDTAIWLSYCRHNVVKNVTVQGINNGVVGSAVSITHGAEHNTIESLHAENVRAGIYSSGSNTNNGYNKILNTEIYADNAAISLSGSSGNPAPGWFIRGGVYSVDDGYSTISVTSRFSGIEISDIDCIGGNQGVNMNAPGYIMKGVRSVGAATNSFRSNNQGNVVGSIMNCTSDSSTPLIVNNNTLPPHRVGNTFDGVILYDTQPPTVGTWKRGDRVIHSDPFATRVNEWVCTSGGTPGTWTPVGIIGES